LREHYLGGGTKVSWKDANEADNGQQARFPTLQGTDGGLWPAALPSTPQYPTFSVGTSRSIRT
jgi:hypothetical protein